MGKKKSTTKFVEYRHVPGDCKAHDFASACKRLEAAGWVKQDGQDPGFPPGSAKYGGTELVLDAEQETRIKRKADRYAKHWPAGAKPIEPEVYPR